MRAYAVFKPRDLFPEYTIRERIADGCIHAIGVTASLVALTALLVIGAQSRPLLWAVSLDDLWARPGRDLQLFGRLYLVVRPKLKEVLRRLDHAAIFLMIAGTYTPFILIKMQTPWGFGLLAVVWTMAAIGIAIKLFAPRFLDGFSTALYLVQGWAVLAAWEPLMSALPGVALTLLMIGGVLYTVGVVFHLWERLPYQNAIWHGIVLSAASCHYAAVIFLLGL